MSKAKKSPAVLLKGDAMHSHRSNVLYYSTILIANNIYIHPPFTEMSRTITAAGPWPICLTPEEMTPIIQQLLVKSQFSNGNTDFDAIGGPCKRYQKLSLLFETFGYFVTLSSTPVSSTLKKKSVLNWRNEHCTNTIHTTFELNSRSRT